MKPRANHRDCVVQDYEGVSDVTAAHLAAQSCLPRRPLAQSVMLMGFQRVFAQQGIVEAKDLQAGDRLVCRIQGFVEIVRVSHAAGGDYVKCVDLPIGLIRNTQPLTMLSEQIVLANLHGLIPDGADSLQAYKVAELVEMGLAFPAQLHPSPALTFVQLRHPAQIIHHFQEDAQASLEH